MPVSSMHRSSVRRSSSEEDPLVEDGASRNEDQTEDYTVRWDLASGNEDDVTVGDITFLGDENTAGEGGADWVRQ